MNMCQTHWDTLREALKTRGLSALVSENSEQAVSNLVREQTEGPSVDSFDPLMAAYLSIGGNGMKFIQEVGGDPMIIMSDRTDLPFDKCTICYLNWMVDEHAKTCTNPECEAQSFDWMINRAANDQVENWKKLNSEGTQHD